MTNDSIPIAIFVALISIVVYIAWSNYVECRSQFSRLYCVTTHLVR